MMGDANCRALRSGRSRSATPLETGGPQLPESVRDSSWASQTDSGNGASQFAVSPAAYCTREQTPVHQRERLGARTIGARGLARVLRQRGCREDRSPSPAAASRLLHIGSSPIGTAEHARAGLACSREGINILAADFACVNIVAPSLIRATGETARSDHRAGSVGTKHAANVFPPDLASGRIHRSALLLAAVSECLQLITREAKRAGEYCPETIVDASPEHPHHAPPVTGEQAGRYETERAHQNWGHLRTPIL